MKRVIGMVLAIVMVMSLMTATVLADGFIESPSVNKAPRMMRFRVGQYVDGEFVESECQAELIITPYLERHTLPGDLKDLIEGAYDQIKACNDVTTLSGELAELAKSLEINGKLLGVSDLFDVRVEGCDPEEHALKEHGQFYITLEADTLDNFVGLLHLENGQWDLVENAAVNGKELSFQADSLSPFAVVVRADGTENPPYTGDSGNIVLWTVLMLVSGVAMVVCLRKSKQMA